MRTRQFAFVAVLTTLTLSSLAAPAQASGRGPCANDRFDTRPRMGTTVVARKNAALIRCAVRRWPVSGGADKAIATFRCESGLWSWAHGNGNYGVGQQRGIYWPARARSYLRPRWFPQHWNRVPTVPQGAYRARANILVSVRMAHSAGWSAWSCA